MQRRWLAVAVDRIVNAREGTSTLDKAIEAIVDIIGQFNGKDVTTYVEAYRAKMIIRNIPEDKGSFGYPWVVVVKILGNSKKLV